MDDDWRYLGYLFLAFFVILKIAFFRESFLVVARSSFALFYLWILPFFPVSLLFKDLDFVERILLSVVFDMSIINILSYWLAVFGVSFGIVHLFLPVIIFLVSLGIFFYKNKNDHKD